MLEEMMKEMSIIKKAQENQNQAAPRNRNRNYRSENNQGKHNENDQQIRPPFQKNYVDQYEEDRELERLEESHVNLIGSDSGDDVFLTEEE